MEATNKGQSITTALTEGVARETACIRPKSDTIVSQGNDQIMKDLPKDGKALALPSPG